MTNMKRMLMAAALTIAAVSPGLAQQQPPQAPTQGGGRQGQAPQPMTFFVTSVSKGDGANYGGLAGADAHCQALAAAVGRGDVRWVAYLSTQGPNAVNARDRIGTGPWVNAKGQQIAASIADFHGDTLEQARLGNRLQKTTALTEKGELVNGVGDTPNQHDILTGSTPTGARLRTRPITPAATTRATRACSLPQPVRRRRRGRRSCSVITIVSAVRTRRGTQSTPAAAAVSRTWFRRAAPACCTALRPGRAEPRQTDIGCRISSTSSRSR